MGSVFNEIQKNAKLTNNKCGLSIVQISKRTELDSPATKKALKKLHKQGKIKVKEGINLKLIFIK